MGEKRLLKITKTEINSLLIIEPEIYVDGRGYFLETFNSKEYKQITKKKFVQDNHSSSTYNVLRGLHFQKTKPQGKLIYVTHGSIMDVAVDLRENSKTKYKWISVVLNERNHKQLWIPPGFAHGFCVLSNRADIIYKCTEYYDPEDEAGIIWDDPTLNIRWPIIDPIVSKKDSKLPKLEEIEC